MAWRQIRTGSAAEIFWRVMTWSAVDPIIGAGCLWTLGMPERSKNECAHFYL